MHRTANLRQLQLTERQMDEIVDQSPEAIDEADAMYRMWTQREPDQDLFIDFEWPDDRVLLGRATGIGYRSDKWEDESHLVTHDYIHRHKEPFPYVVMQRPFKKDVKKRRANLVDSELQQTIAAELFEQPRFINKKFEKPKEFVYAQLGYALDLEYERDGEIQQIDWTDDESPLLAADTKRNLLIILPLDGGYPVLMWSPIMKVTARGIEN